jgi:ATP-binding cassette subfamily B protein
VRRAHPRRADGGFDARAEHEIFQILRAMARDKVAIGISHRLALARSAHRIAVMADGKIVESGTHEELMALRGAYYDMFNRQASSDVTTAEVS